MNQSTVSLHNVAVAYDDNVVLHDITLDIEAGEFVGIVGPNGAGKSTLLNALLGIVPLANGSITVLNESPGAARARLAYMPQREAVDWTFPVTVSDVVLMGRQARIGWFHHATARDHDLVNAALNQVQMQGNARTPIGKLSGGQQQRVFLARALAQEGELLLLDEPLTGVDAPTQETILNLLEAARARGRTVLMTTHDLGVARAFCSKLLFLNRACIAYGTPAETFTTDVLQKTYGGHIVRVGSDSGAAEALDDALLILRDDTHHH